MLSDLVKMPKEIAKTREQYLLLSATLGHDYRH